MSSLQPPTTTLSSDDDTSRKPKSSTGNQSYNLDLLDGFPDPEIPLVEFKDDAFNKYYRRKVWFVVLIRSCCLISVISVCLNTPQTFEKFNSLRYVTLALDCVTGLVLVSECIIKIISKGFIFGKRSYLKSGGRLFEFTMTTAIVISIILQILELSISLDKKFDHYLAISLVRSLRPFLLLRVMKSVLKLSLPKTLPRSLKQIWGVLLFTAYFMTLAAFVGVQMFGLMKYYCVRNGASLNATNYDDLLVPAQRCTPEKLKLSEYKCPAGFSCSEIEFKKFRQDRRYFDHAATGLLTVYETASLEGWSMVMYDVIDTRFFMYGVIYFICVVFFIAWLVRNVFIAIITEAFADLRLQVNKLAQTKSTKDMDDYQVLRKIENSDMLLVKEKQVIPTQFLTKAAYNLSHSKLIKYFVLVCVLTDALVQALYHDENKIDGVIHPKMIIQIFFTVLFDVEAFIKLIGMGWSAYMHSVTCRFELVLCIGSTAFLALVLTGHKAFVVFQVIRLFRVLLIWNSLTSFVQRILGSGKKITSLMFFTLVALVIASGIALQLFCPLCLPNERNCTAAQYGEFQFGLFPYAMKAIFQVFMSEGWNNVMDQVLYVGEFGYSFLVFAVFILFHLFAATILISVFVALILDNLESSEELKLLKQKRLGEEVADTHKKVPTRIRVFKHLKPHPNLVKVPCLDADVLPKVRQSFLSKYLHNAENVEFEVPLLSKSLEANTPIHRSGKRNAIINGNIQLSMVENQPTDGSFLAKFRKQSSVTMLMHEAHIKRISIHSTGSDFTSSRRSIKRGLSKRTNTPNLRSLSETSANNRILQPTGGIRLTNVSGIINQTKKLKDKNNKVKDVDVSLVRQRLQEAQLKKEAVIEELRENHPTFDKSLFLFSKDNWFRKLVLKLVHARYNAFDEDEKNLQVGAFSIDRVKRYLGSQTYLDWFMLVCTQVSCLAMLAETPRIRTFDRTWMRVIEYIFVASSSIEIFLKVVANGLFFSPNAFIQDIGGILHVLIYIVSLTYVAWKPEIIPPGSAAQILIALRALRPLRIITLAPQLRNVVWVLVRGYKDIFRVALLQFVVMFVFASYGVQTLSGRLRSCNDSTKTSRDTCKGIFVTSIALPSKLAGLNGSNPQITVPRVWRNPRSFNFDNMGSALLTLWEVLSLEGWTTVRDILEKQVGWEASLYPHVYIFIACLIGLTLFIGVIVNNFNENKGTALLTVEQKRWKDLKKKLELAQPLHLPSRPKEGTMRAFLYDIFIGKTYNLIYALCILVNCGTLCFGQWQPADIREEFVIALVSVSMICCVLFMIDTVLKIFAFTLKGYWLSWRNRLDFFLSILGFAFCVWTGIACRTSFMDDQCGNSRNFGVAVFTLRFLSLSGKHNGLRMLMLTVLMSLSKSFFTISVLLMIMASYAFIAVVMFGSVKHGLALNDKANFETSWSALLLTFRITTGEDWNQIMHDASITAPYCRVKPALNYWESNCGNRVAALVFFHSYYVIITYIFLNLFIAVVIENFSIFYSTDDYPILSAQDITHYQEKWNFVDKEKSGTISLVKARVVLILLTGGLDLRKQKHHPLLFKRICAELERTRNNKDITFHNLLFVLAYKKIDHGKSLQLEERLARSELEMTIWEEVASETIRNWIIKKWKSRKEINSKRLERKPSAVSGDSRLSFESAVSENDEPNQSISSIPSNKFQISAITDTKQKGETDDYPKGLRRRRNDKKEYRSEFYSWWDDEVEDV